MGKIIVKDSQWYLDLYPGMSEVKVYVNETKAQHDARVKKENRKHAYDLYMGYSGYDEHPDTEEASNE